MLPFVNLIQRTFSDLKSFHFIHANNCKSFLVAWSPFLCKIYRRNGPYGIVLCWKWETRTITSPGKSVLTWETAAGRSLSAETPSRARRCSRTNSVSNVTISHSSDWYIIPYITLFAFCVTGYVCERKDLLVNGCCNVIAPSSRQYICKSCLANGCCSIYEYCVSCCLQPDKVTWPNKKMAFLCHICCIKWCIQQSPSVYI